MHMHLPAQNPKCFSFSQVLGDKLVLIIAQWNHLADNGKTSYILGVNDNLSGNQSSAVHFGCYQPKVVNVELIFSERSVQWQIQVAHIIIVEKVSVIAFGNYLG